MTPREQVIEAMARAQCLEMGFNPDLAEEDDLRFWRFQKSATTAALDALLATFPALGLAVVPVEATREMKNAAWMHVTTGLELGWDSTMSELLAAAIAAAPSPLAEEDAP